jgi:hypothetical protein
MISGLREIIVSLLRCTQSDLNMNDIKKLQIGPSTTIILFPGISIWALLVTSPLSATQSKTSCNIFTASTTTTRIAEAFDIENLKLYFSSYVQSLEQNYRELLYQSPQTPEPPNVSLLHLLCLKKHLQLERAAGIHIFPASQSGRREKSETFCRAEKGELTPYQHIYITSPYSN